MKSQDVKIVSSQLLLYKTLLNFSNFQISRDIQHIFKDIQLKLKLIVKVEGFDFYSIHPYGIDNCFVLNAYN